MIDRLESSTAETQIFFSMTQPLTDREFTKFVTLREKCLNSFSLLFAHLNYQINKENQFYFSKEHIIAKDKYENIQFSWIFLPFGCPSRKMYV